MVIVSIFHAKIFTVSLLKLLCPSEVSAGSGMSLALLQEDNFFESCREEYISTN